VEDEGDEEVEGVARLFSAEEDAVEVEAMPPLCVVSPVSDEEPSDEEPSDDEKAAEEEDDDDEKAAEEEDDDGLHGGLYDSGGEGELLDEEEGGLLDEDEDDEMTC
jgi:hypothetical protein